MSIAQKTINTIRVLAADTVQKANSGHPGAPMGMAPMAYAVWMQKMKHDPTRPEWPDRDRFVLSSGHASALEYVLLHLMGYGLEMEDLKAFRQWGSKTPGHPEYRHTVGIETTTGPLGQGVANAVGFAIAETMLAAKFNRPGFPVVDHRVYAFCGDGCMMEGISSEACSLAGTLSLGKLTLLYDDNGISIEGNTDIAFCEDVGTRFEAYGWQVIRVQDGNDYQQVLDALTLTESDDRPSLIICPTAIGYGCPDKQGKASAHGEPLGEANVLAAKRALGMAEEAFCVPDDVYRHTADIAQVKHAARAMWEMMFEKYRKAYPELAEEWDLWHEKKLPDSIQQNGSLWEFPAKEATRNTSHITINRLAQILPNLVGGSADLSPSTKTYIKDGGDYSKHNRSGRNLHFGVREHAMGAICNGMALHGGLRVFCATFFVFSDYMKHAVRMAAIMRLPVTFVFTHDSIGVGEDGATHQPIEQLAGLRATPDVLVYRPCDGHETATAWLTALSAEMPVCLVLSRQALPMFEHVPCEAFKGGYVLSDCDKPEPDVLLMASGSEVAPMMEAQAILKERGVAARVVSMPCMELFLTQSDEYKESVLPGAVRARVAMEAGASMPWYRFTGLSGAVIAIDHYGASAPAQKLFSEFGFTAENAVKAAERVMENV